MGANLHRARGEKQNLEYNILTRILREESELMITLKIPLPDDIRSALSIDDEELAALALEALLVRLYERGDLSSGKVAELLRIPRREFLKLLDNYGVLIFDEDADIAAEAQHGRL